MTGAAKQPTIDHTARDRSDDTSVPDVPHIRPIPRSTVFPSVRTVRHHDIDLTRGKLTSTTRPLYLRYVYFLKLLKVLGFCLKKDANKDSYHQFD